MEITFTDNTGNTASINVLRGNIQTELNQGNRVLVRFLQPGVMYEKDDVWHTVIDFMNEWQGRPVRFQSNLVPLKKCEVEFEYTNDMFFTGPRLYQENKMCVGLLTKLIGVAEKDTNKYWDLLLGRGERKQGLVAQYNKNPSCFRQNILDLFWKRHKERTLG